MRKESTHQHFSIMSDCWKDYGCLEDEGFKHHRVEHRLNFDDPGTCGQTPVEQERREESRPGFGLLGLRNTRRPTDGCIPSSAMWMNAFLQNDKGNVTEDGAPVEG